MPINTKRMIAAVAVAAFAIGGVAGTVFSSPAFAIAQEAEVSEEETEPNLTDAIQKALSQLVTDKVITQTQADAVTDTLVESLPARGPHRGFRGGVQMATVATVIGIDVRDLMDALRDGSTIAEIAVERGAAALLMPVSCRRQLFDLSDDMATKIDVQFYSDARDALLKAVAE